MKKKNLIIGGAVALALLLLGCVTFITTRGGTPEEVVAEVDTTADEQVIENDNQFAQDIVMRAESEVEATEVEEPAVEEEPTVEEEPEEESSDESIIEVADSEETTEGVETTEVATTSKASTTTNTAAVESEYYDDAAATANLLAQYPNMKMVEVANDGRGRGPSDVDLTWCRCE